MAIIIAAYGNVHETDLVDSTLLSLPRISDMIVTICTVGYSQGVKYTLRKQI